MSRTLLFTIFITAFLATTVVFIENSFFSGAITIKTYLLISGLIFLSVGLYVGFRSKKEKVVVREIEKQIIIEREVPVEKIQDVVINHNELLSNRENEVLRYIIMGLSNKEIADKIFVSENTVKTHINNIYSKMGVNRRAQAISKARELNIVD